MDPATKWLIRAAYGVVIATAILTMQPIRTTGKGSRETRLKRWAGKNQASEEHAWDYCWKKVDLHFNENHDLKWIQKASSCQKTTKSIATFQDYKSNP